MTTINFRGLHNSNGTVWLYRSANLDSISPQTRQELRDLEITQIIDLRSSRERLALPESNESDITVVHRPLYPDDAPPSVGNISQVYHGLITQSGDRITGAIRAIANQQDGVSLVHCKVGKDRTGIVVALASLAVGIDRDTVIADYAASGNHVRAAFYDEVNTQLLQLQLDERTYTDALELHLDTPATAITRVIDFVETEAGGVHNYLMAGGMSTGELDLLHARYERTPTIENSAAHTV